MSIQNYDQWRDSCPTCGADLFVVQVFHPATNRRYQLNSTLYADGFYFDPGTKDASTEDEEVECANGHPFKLAELEIK